MHMDTSTFAAIEGFMLSCMDDSAHDKEHVYRVLSNALVIAKSDPGVDYDVLICACLLHDIGRVEQMNDPGLCHAEVGSVKAHRFLIGSGFTPEFAEKVSACIRTHRFRRSDQPQSLEAKILFDADKLDVAGAVGIARTLVYKGAVSAPLYTRKPDGTIADGTEGGASFFGEYKFKLENLYDRFYTEEGRRMALERRKTAASFYADLYDEVNQFDLQGREQLNKILQD